MHASPFVIALQVASRRFRCTLVVSILASAVSGSAALAVAAPAASQLKLTTEKVIVFKDGYALIVKRGAAQTDENGVIYTDEVPDSAVLGSFWATPKAGTLVSTLAGWQDEETKSEKEMVCDKVIDVLGANIGKRCTIQISDKTLTGVIARVLTTESEAPVADTQRAVLGLSRAGHPHLSALSSSLPTPIRPAMIRRETGSFFVLATDEGDVLVPAAAAC